MIPPLNSTTPNRSADAERRATLLLIRRALLMIIKRPVHDPALVELLDLFRPGLLEIVHAIETRYCLDPTPAVGDDI